VADADVFRAAFVALEVSDSFTQAEVCLCDGSSLVFFHRVDERKVEATGSRAGHASGLLPTIARFRLNAKHLDIQFADGTRWEALLGNRQT